MNPLGDAKLSLLWKFGLEFYRAHQKVPAILEKTNTKETSVVTNVVAVPAQRLEQW